MASMFKKLSFLLAFTALLGATPAVAQSACSYIVYGAVLTAAQWNACFQAKQNVLTSGTATTVLHGNLSGLPTWGAVNLTTDVTGILPVANGGWGGSTGTSGGVLYFNSSTTLASSAALTANQIVVGGGAGTAPLTVSALPFIAAVNLNAASLQAAQTGTLFQGQASDSAIARAELDSFGAISSFTGVVAGGTKASPTAVTNGTQLTGINAYAYNGASFVGPIVSFRTYAAENIASGHQGSKACIAVTPNSSTTLADSFCVNQDGSITAAANSIALTTLAQSAANTILGNWTSGTANVSANAMPSCADSGGNHLNYVNGTGITCGTSGAAATFPQNYLTGLTLSTAGSSATFTVAAGQAADSTNAVSMARASSLAKTTGSWAVGAAAGCLDTGSIATSTWYTVYEIERTDLTVVDILCSTNATTPTMPTNYTYKRRIGSMKTNGSSQWTSFTQVGRNFYWPASVLDVNGVAGNGTWTLVTLTVPTGANVQPIITVNANVSDSTEHYVGVQSGVVLPTVNFGQVHSNTGAFSSGGAISDYATNTLAQLYVLASNGNLNYSIYTSGWFDAAAAQ